MPIQAQREESGVTPAYWRPGAKCGWVFSTALRPLYLRFRCRSGQERKISSPPGFDPLYHPLGWHHYLAHVYHIYFTLRDVVTVLLTFRLTSLRSVHFAQPASRPHYVGQLSHQVIFRLCRVFISKNSAHVKSNIKQGSRLVKYDAVSIGK
jgi:hypothetical protein